MNLKDLIKEVEKQEFDPTIGLPETLFEFATRVTPMVNVDLFVRNFKKEILLTWRGGNYYSPGWHIPGGIVRLRESLYDRLELVAQKELKAKISYKTNPILINEIIRFPERINRTHFISFLFETELSTPLENSSEFNHAKPENGQWKWHKYCPKNIIPVHLMYKNIINGCSPESECTSDFGKSRVIFFNEQ